MTAPPPPQVRGRLCDLYLENEELRQELAGARAATRGAESAAQEAVALGWRVQQAAVANADRDRKAVAVAIAATQSAATQATQAQTQTQTQDSELRRLLEQNQRQLNLSGARWTEQNERQRAGMRLEPLDGDEMEELEGALWTETRARDEAEARSVSAPGNATIGQVDELVGEVGLCRIIALYRRSSTSY
jgi:hypothetical protein